MSKAYVSSAELKLENPIFDEFRTDMNLIIREKSQQLSRLACFPNIQKQERHCNLDSSIK